MPRYVVCLHKSRGTNVCLSACTLFTHQIMFTTSLHTVDKPLISKRVHCCALEKPRLYIGRDSQYTSVAISLQMREVGLSHVLCRCLPRTRVGTTNLASGRVCTQWLIIPRNVRLRQTVLHIAGQFTLLFWFFVTECRLLDPPYFWFNCERTISSISR